MVALGKQDGIDSVNGGQTEVANTAHYFMLKTSRDERVSGRDYDEFKAMKASGLFGEEYNLLSDEKARALFLH